MSVRLHLRCLEMNKTASQEAVRWREGLYAGVVCPVAAVGAVIRGIECVSLHDSQLVSQGAAHVAV